MIDIRYAIAPDVSVVPPKLAYDGDSGFDLYSAEEELLTLAPGKRKVVRTGIHLEIPSGYEGQVRSKSGLAANKGCVVLNSPGTIDSGYRGEIHVILYNTSQFQYSILPGEKIAQIVFCRVESTNLTQVGLKDLLPSDRGSKGFGSSGIK